MRTRIIISILAAMTSALAFADSPYGQKAKIENPASQKGKSVIWCGVRAMSNIKRTPEMTPRDGDYETPIRVVAAKGEFEPASFLLLAKKDLSDVTISVSDLTAAAGAKIPASAIDVKVVKIWYQQGTAWAAFHSDFLRRIPTPELLLHDENMIRVDHATKENYLRADYLSGKQRDHWISFYGNAVDHSMEGNPNTKWIHDAETLRPFALFKDEFKQFWATVRIPENAADGIYKGNFSVKDNGGHELTSIPFEVRVLPFTLPKPATFRDLKREFYGSGYIGGGMNVATMEKVAKNLAEHNCLNPLLPEFDSDEIVESYFKFAEKYGLGTDAFFCALPGCGCRTSFPPDETDDEYLKYMTAVARMEKVIERLQKHLKDKPFRAYSYAIDEAGPATVRQERGTWHAFQSRGGNIFVTSGYHPFLLFCADCVNCPRQPDEARGMNAEKLHAANPDTLVAWYGDPHSGPENPAYCRRLYGWQTWRNNYDMTCQFILFRDDWPDFFVQKEAFLRGLMLAYMGDEQIIDTIAWEGYREGIDDVRYATLLRQKAALAIASKNTDTQYAGRAAATWLTQVDGDRSSLDAIRMEIIERILNLNALLEKEGK